MLPLSFGGLGECAVVDTERTGFGGWGGVEGQVDGAVGAYGLEIEGRLKMGAQRA